MHSLLQYWGLLRTVTYVRISCNVHAGEEGNHRDSPLNGHPRFYSPIFLVAKDLGGWCPVLNLKAFNRYVLMSHFYIETLQTVTDYIGEAVQHRRNASEHLRDSETDMSSLYQFERRLFSCPRDTRAHKISSLCLRRESVQIPSAPLRSLYSPRGIHNGRKSKGTRGEYAPVPRLAPQ